MTKTPDQSAWLAAKVAILCTIITIAVQLAIFFFDAHNKHREELMQRRREALFSALEVIDHVYANVSMNGKPPSNPHSWDVSIARNAMNGMVVYCENPNRALAAFADATGLYNPDLQTNGLFGPKGLTEFRNVICQELGTGAIKYNDTNRVWIYSMPGAK